MGSAEENSRPRKLWWSQAILEAQGYCVVVFWEIEIDKNSEDVSEQLRLLTENQGK